MGLLMVRSWKEEDGGANLISNVLISFRSCRHAARAQPPTINAVAAVARTSAKLISCQTSFGHVSIGGSRHKVWTSSNITRLSHLSSRQKSYQT